MEDECSKHPENFKGLAPKEFAKEFGYTNYFYQKECFKELAEEYKNQSKGDYKLGREKLSSGLEKLSKAIKGPIRKAIEEVCYACRKYLKNPFNNYNKNNPL